jgi:hypothetical protein
MKSIILIFCYFLCLATVAQNKDTFISKFELSVNYGMAGNFHVDYGEDLLKDGGNIVPLYSEVFDTFKLHQKNFIGTSGGFTVAYNLNTKNALTFSFDRNIHNGKYDGTFTLANGTPIFVRDIVLRQRNHFVSLTYRRSLNKKNNFYVHLGINYLRHNQAEIDIGISENFVVIEERNYDNANFEEGGFVIGFEKYFYKSGKFELGIQSKLFLLTSNPNLIETLTLVPVLRFGF